MNFLKVITKNLLKCFWFFSVKNGKVFLISFDGTTVGFDNKALVKWSNDNNLQYDFIWGVKEKKYEKSLELRNTNFVKIKSLRGFFHLITSSAVIFNINPPSYIPFRKSQTLINTWHGFPYKKVGKYADSFNEKQFNLANCFISYSQSYTKQVLKDSFCYNGEILNSGAPRNDIFFTKKVDLIAKTTKEKLNLRQDFHYVLYAPTFRGDFKLNEFKLDFKRLKYNLNLKFGGNWGVLLRIHPMIFRKYNFTCSDVINVSNYPDMQDLLCLADVLITDYSSSMWDFSLLKRPVFVYATDVKEYQKDRGFYLNPDLWPFSIANTNDQLFENIKKFNSVNYNNSIKNYLFDNVSYENGSACNKIFEYLNNKKRGF